ncbi:MAG TPA: cytochrome P450 [Acidimicrobiales bacterium]|nr:cytochrome P450 [Acidimicrobiales bacterium]
MTTQQTRSADDIDLSDLEFWAAPWADREAAFKTLRQTRPIAFFEEPEMPEEMPFPQGPGYFAITRYHDIVEMSRHPELFCSGQSATSIFDMPQEFLEFFGSMINMDDPRHARLRRIVSAAFNPRMVSSVEATIQAVADSIIDTVRAEGECDFVTQVASRLPLKVICDMMGIPESDYDTVFHASNVILSAGDTEYIPEGADPVVTLLNAGAELAGLMEGLAAFRADNPTDDLTSELLHANVDGESLTHAELASFFILLLVAGNETTRNAISHGLWLLTEHPDQRAVWTGDVDGVTATAVDEIVRWATPVIFMRRTVTGPTTLSGHEFQEGNKVILFYNSANRDEDVFADSDVFDVTRSPNPHVGFGAPGPHFCLGAHLARREMSVMFRELFRHLPTITASGEPDRLQSNFINGIKHLPCTFSPGGG